MRREYRGDRFMIFAVCFCLFLCFVGNTVCEALFPEASGTDVRRSDGLTVDFSHADQGYVMVKGKTSKKKLKLRVTKDDTVLNYDIDKNERFEVIPLQMGNGNYRLALYKNVQGKQYAEEGKVSLKVDMPDELSCFLYPNQYIWYEADSPVVQKANELCAGLTNPKDKYKKITQYIVDSYAYDFIRAVTIKQGALPDVEACYKKKMGICQDLAALTVCMMRSQGIPSKLVIGTVGANSYHAWTVNYVNGQEAFFDPTAELHASPRDQVYVVERFY